MFRIQQKMSQILFLTENITETRTSSDFFSEISCSKKSQIAEIAKRFEPLGSNKTGTSKVGAISKAQKAQFSKYAQDVFMKSFENTFETPKVCLSCSI